jgi:hypothetical protein
MSDLIPKIRSLLDELETKTAASESAAATALVSGLELPDILRDVVDLLMPQLKPYEASLYFYMLRHSIVENGSPYVRISRRSLQSGVIKSSYAGTGKGGESGAGSASYDTIRTTLKSMEALGAIRQESEPTREGTLYRVLLPEEIEACKLAREARSAVVARTVDHEREADFYNVRENRRKVYERDDYVCRYCSKKLTRFTATLDHVKPIAEGGDHSLANLVTACLDCNSRKNARAVGDFYAER